MIIKKLNSMFHKHSRWLFGIFAIVIIIAFMDFLTPGAGGCSSSDPADLPVGTINGEKVTYGELQNFGKKFYTYLDLMARGNQQLDNQTLFSYYALSKRLEKMGFHISDTRASEILKRSPRFRKDGKFDIKAYNKFITDTRIKESDVIAAIRVGALHEEYVEMLKKSIAVSDDEVKDKFYSLETEYAVKTITIATGNFLKDVKKPSDKELKEFFAAAQANGAYMHPVQNAALIAELPMEKFKAEAAKKLTAKELKAYTDARLKELKESKKKPSAAELKQEKIERDAQILAMAEGKKFPAAFQTLKTTPQPEREAKFRAIAKKLGLKITATGMKADPRFDHIPLRTCELSPVSATFVADRIASKPMSFEEAKKASLIDNCNSAKAREKALEITAKKAEVDKLIAAKKADVKDDNINLAQFYYMIKQYDDMISRELEKDNPQVNIIQFASSIKQNIVQQLAMLSPITLMAKGEYSKPFPAGEDKIMVLQLVKRTKPASDKELTKEKRELIRTDIVNVKAQGLFEELFRSIDKESKYTAEERNPRK